MGCGASYEVKNYDINEYCLFTDKNGTVYFYFTHTCDLYKQIKVDEEKELKYLGKLSRKNAYKYQGLELKIVDSYVKQEMITV